MVLSSTEQPFTSVFLVLEAFPKPPSHEREAHLCPGAEIPASPPLRAFPTSIPERQSPWREDEDQ